ncbi:MAG: sugar phosphorylase [Caldilineaceae bacterium]|nr:sugar phosphorylase [Caldilineaceae bacterium]
MIPATRAAALQKDLAFLYPPEQAQAAYARLRQTLERFLRDHPAPPEAGGSRTDERDVILITYGDQVQEPGRPPLQSLAEFLTEQVDDFLTGLHILPFFPFTSDDGFAVADYDAVSPLLGEWEQVEAMSRQFRLMVDLVVNHVSASHDWIKGFRIGDPRYAEYVITADPRSDLSMVVRPRALPLLTPMETAQGIRHVWTTFSTDQIDLNFANPDVLLAMTDVLLDYLSRGVQIIRLDAIAYLWKEAGTTCIHLPQTHRVIQFWRTVFDIVAPNTVIITETNVPHAENISYFGNGRNEAQLVYNFSLPPLLLHTFYSGDTRSLQQWAATLSTPGDRTTYFNFLASHDGVGIRPLEGLLSNSERQTLVERTQAHGGNVSFKANPDGTQSPYELNINYFDALNNPHADEAPAMQVSRFMAAQAILLAMQGVPGIYIHSLFGSRNWAEGVTETGRLRTINRRKWQRSAIEAELADPASLRSQVFNRFRTLIEARTGESAFHPQGSQRIMASPPELFTFLRDAPDANSSVLCVHNVTAQPQECRIDPADYAITHPVVLTDLLEGIEITLEPGQPSAFSLPPYGVAWLRFPSQTTRNNAASQEGGDSGN